MGEETEFRFDESATAKKKSAMAEFGKFLWNSETKEFCGRDGASWGKQNKHFHLKIKYK